VRENSDKMDGEKLSPPHDAFTALGSLPYLFVSPLPELFFFPLPLYRCQESEGKFFPALFCARDVLDSSFSIFRRGPVSLPDTPGCPLSGRPFPPTHPPFPLSSVSQLKIGPEKLPPSLFPIDTLVTFPPLNSPLCWRKTSLHGTMSGVSPPPSAFFFFWFLPPLFRAIEARCFLKEVAGRLYGMKRHFGCFPDPLPPFSCVCFLSPVFITFESFLWCSSG